VPNKTINKADLTTRQKAFLELISPAAREICASAVNLPPFESKQTTDSLKNNV
jgi:hypothetical protein